MRRKTTTLLLFATLAAGFCGADVLAEESVGPAEWTLPIGFNAFVAVTAPPTRGTAVSTSQTTRVQIVVERWITDEERLTLAQALAEGGTPALVDAMGELDLGSIRIGNAGTWPIRTASVFPGDGGTVVRLATDRDFFAEELWFSTRSAQYPIGVVQFTLPEKGSGEGALVIATRLSFNEDGQIVVESLPGGAAPQRLINVKPYETKRAKKKKKAEEENR